MKRLSIFVVASAACLTLQISEAAVSINSQQSFGSAPPVADWSSRSVPQTAGTTPSGGETTTSAQMDAIIQTNTAAMINGAIVDQGGTAANGLARRETGGAFVFTRPTGNTATILMVTLTNSSGGNFPTPTISYDLGIPNAIAGEDAELAGHVVYYSLTGLENSWTLIPGLTTTTPVAGPVNTTLSLGTWAANSLLYIIWVDDNGANGGDGSFSIDNFIVSVGIPCPEILTQPSNTNSLVGRTVSLSVLAQGPGLTYQWNKVGVGPIDTLANPSAATATLTITNAQFADTGDYNVTVANSCGSVTSTSAHIEILADTEPPRLLAATIVGPGLNTFRLTTDEQLCADELACGTDSLFAFFWTIVQADDPNGNLGLAGDVVMINPTTYEFTTSIERIPGKVYRICADDFGGVGDLSGNRVPAGTCVETVPQASFQQGDANGYASTQDTELHSLIPADTVQGAATAVTIDNDDAGVAHGLLRFDNIFGTGAGQIPPGAVILSATLTLNQTDPGSSANFHRMLVPWDQSTATWNSMVDGIAADGVEAATASDALSLNEVPNGPHVLNVTASVQAWAGGQANYGWGVISTGTGGWDWNTSESGAATAPLLTVEYRVVPCTGVPTITVQPPTAVAANELQPFSISVTVANGCGTFQWTKDGTDIIGANNLTYSVASAGPGDAGRYRLRATNPDGSVTSDEAVVTFVPKTSRPYVTRVVSSANGTTITVAFNEAVSTASAQATANYTLTPSVAVSSAVLGANNTVTLTTAARSIGTAYSLRIAGVTDVAAVPNAINPNPTVVALTSSSVVPGAEFAGTWSCNTNNLDTDPTWKNVGYVPGADWITGSGLFGDETSAAILGAAPAPINTPLLAPNDLPDPELGITAYFFKSITLPALPAGARYVICHFTDDGHITYLDGVEINRYGMPAGAVTFTNRSTGIPNGGEASMRAFGFTATAGEHKLAVELHQAGTASSDVLFGMEVRVVMGTSPTLSISRTGTPLETRLSWNADSTWQLRGNNVVTGPYENVALPAGTRLGTYTVPTALATSTNNFYLLDYICLP